MLLGEGTGLVAVARDPECVFAYWGARLPGGTILRLVEEGGEVTREMVLAEGAGNAYLPAEPDTEYRVELVVEGRVAGRTRVRTPRAGVSAEVDARWKGATREEKVLKDALRSIDPRRAPSSPRP